MISCGQARDELALEVGQDLEPGPELRDHLVDCHDCCRAWLALQESHGHLQHLKLGSPVVESPGLWHGVEVAIQDRGLRPEGSTFPSWLLGMAVGVLFILFFLDSIRPTSDAETLVIEMPVRDLSTSIEVPYRPQWPPLKAARPMELELVEIAPSNAHSGRVDEMPVVRRFRWPRDSGRITLSPYQLVNRPIRRPGFAEVSPPAIRIRPWRRPIGTPFHKISGTIDDADF